VSNLNEIIESYTAKISDALKEVLPQHPNETEFRMPIDRLLEDFCAEAKLDPLAEAEYTLAGGRADAVFNRMVIEYERPGTLRKTLSHHPTAHAIDQVKRYIEGLAKQRVTSSRELPALCLMANTSYLCVIVRANFKLNRLSTLTQIL